MKRTTLASLAYLLFAGVVSAQVLTPMELSDPKTQRLQQRNIKTLAAIGTEIAAHKFPYPFYFSRVLDVDLSKMQTADQRSIRFDLYKSQTVLEITGNYYASYSADLMGPYARLKETFSQVMLPMLEIAVPHFPDDSEFSAFAIEVSHHLRQKTSGVSLEHPENVTLIIPVPAAQKLVDATTDAQRQAAALDATVFLNGEPYSLWLQDGTPTDEWKEANSTDLKTRRAQSAQASPKSDAGGPQVSPQLMNASATELRILTPDALSKLQFENQDRILRITDELNKEAHFVPYAPPTFVAFRHVAYLQLSVITQLNTDPQSSRYKLAALAFDEHVSHLVRPVLQYFTGDTTFDGVSFSSIIHTSGGQSSLAVEFYFPFRLMQCFANFECTGQQLLDSGTVVINGERAAVNLQTAEGRN
jgi:hypothetical protein